MESVDFSSIIFTVEVDGEKHRVEDIEDLASVVPHENDVVSFNCPNSHQGIFRIFHILREKSTIYLFSRCKNLEL